MTVSRPIKFMTPPTVCLISVLAFLVTLLIPQAGLCETFGIKDAQGKFVPKVEITVRKKEVVIKKTEPTEKFDSLSLTINPKDTNLIKNVAHLNIQWQTAGKAGRPIPFMGARYDPNTRVFSDTMTRSTTLKIIDTSKLNLFRGKTLADLFTVQIEDQVLVSSESAIEKDRTVQLGTGRDVSIKVDKNAILFDESNLKKGEMLNVDNRSGYDQILGVELPKKGFLVSQIRRRLEQTKILQENWERFTMPADSGIFVVLIPEADPDALAQLDGKEIVIKAYQGNKIRETRKIPIKVAADLMKPGPRISPPEGPTEPEDLRSARAATKTPGPRPEMTAPRPQPATASAESARKQDRAAGLWWIWILQIVNLALLVAVGSYGIFFMLPRIQVLEDRLAKNEMFLHGSREAIREELEQIKKEILQQCLQETRK
jgi:hypothetical protein